MYQLPIAPSELSLVARQGSGSACRSLLGGFVAWEMGTAADGDDSIAVEVAPREHWPEMHALICVVSDDKKGTSSTSGMQRTVETSTLLQHRAKEIVPKRMEAISTAIKAKDFDTFAKITMQDSNQFHAVALDTDPPIFYMNDISRAIVALIVEFNRVSVAAGLPIRAAYTHDAGPNTVIFALDKDVKDIINLVATYFPSALQAFDDRISLFKSGQNPGKGPLPVGFNEAVAKKYENGGVKSFIHTRVGDGPRVLGDDEALLGGDGLPISKLF